MDRRKTNKVILKVFAGIFGLIVLLIIIGAIVGAPKKAAERKAKMEAKKKEAAATTKNITLNNAPEETKIKLPDNFIKVDNVTKLQVDGLYYLSDPAILAPAFKPEDVSKAMRQMKKIPKGYFFLIKASKIKAINPWYNVEIIKPGKNGGIVERGWINSTNLLQQDDLRQVIKK